MKDLMVKIGRFCENHVEKIVLVLVGGFCVLLFFARVIFSPNVIVVDDRSFTPGSVDRYIQEEKAAELREKLRQRRTGDGKAYASRLDGRIDANDPVVAGIVSRPLSRGFLELFETPVVLDDTPALKPRPVEAERRHARKYKLPRIGEVTDVAANHIRAVAYVPLQDVTAGTTYDKAQVEPNDIDLVTVEAKFDVAELYRRFYASFAGVDVQKEEWRDPCLAEPTFAAVQLQRQELLEDGSYSDWREVPRSRVESYRDLYQVIERIEDLPPGGLEVRMMQFDRKDIALGLLQPEPYRIASAEEEWFPPSFYDKFKTLQRKVELEEKREEREKERKQDTRTDTRRDSTGRGGMYGATGRVPRGTRATGTTGQDSAMPGYGTERGGRGTRSPRGTTSTTRSPSRRGAAGGDMVYEDAYAMTEADRRKSSTDEAYIEFAQELVNYRTDLSKRDKPLLVWGFDDTAEPGKVYRYRLRVGAFNPVAGTNQLVELDMDKKDQVILWSDYSEVTQPVEVPRMLYLFAKNVQERTKTATVEVARYRLGYWRTEDFQVRPGESIGKEVEPREEEDRPRSRLLTNSRITDPRASLLMQETQDYMIPAGPDQLNKPKTVDYTTGKLLVDLVQVNAPNLHPQPYYDMLYTGDGMRIEHMPVKVTCWPRDLVAAYQHIQGEKRKEAQPFRPFSKGGLRGRGQFGPEGYDGMYPGMMNDMGGEMGPYRQY